MGFQEALLHDSTELEEEAFSLSAKDDFLGQLHCRSDRSQPYHRLEAMYNFDFTYRYLHERYLPQLLSCLRLTRISPTSFGFL